MSTDLEARLTRAMRDADGPEALDVDTDAVLSEGHRVLRRRRAAAGGVGAAVLLVLTTVLAVIVPHQGSLIPAGPSRSVHVVERYQVEVESVSTRSDSRLEIAYASGEEGGDGSGGTISVTELDGAGDRRSLTSYALRDLVDTPAGPGGVHRIDGGELLVVTPAGAQSVETISDGERSSSSAQSDAEVLGRSGLQVSVVTTTPADAPLVDGVRWRSGDRLVSTTGERYRTARIPGPGDYLAWVSEDGSTMGVLNAGLTTQSSVDDARPGITLVSTGADTSPLGRGVTRAEAVGLIPAGATDPEMTWEESWTVDRLQSVRLPGRGETVVVGNATTTLAPYPAPDPHLTWTDADGQVHSED